MNDKCSCDHYVCCCGLESGEVRVLNLIADRLRLGKKLYGPLNVAMDKRNWRREWLEELMDGTVYAALALACEEQGK